MDLTPLYLQRLDVTADLIGNVKADQLADPTHLSEWDVRTLLNHFIGSTMEMALAVAGEGAHDPSAPTPDLVGRAGDDPAAAVAPALAKAKEAWSAPGAIDQESIPVGDGSPARSTLRIALMEAVVHGWDIAKATHQAYEIPDELAQPMLDGMVKLMGDRPRPPGFFFGPVIEVPEDAPVADKLLAFTGRTP